jgi:hypothetical protein
LIHSNPLEEDFTPFYIDRYTTYPLWFGPRRRRSSNKLDELIKKDKGKIKVLRILARLFLRVAHKAVCLASAGVDRALDMHTYTSSSSLGSLSTASEARSSL